MMCSMQLAERAPRTLSSNLASGLTRVKLLGPITQLGLKCNKRSRNHLVNRFHFLSLACSGLNS